MIGEDMSYENLLQCCFSLDFNTVKLLFSTKLKQLIYLTVKFLSIFIDNMDTSFLIDFLYKAFVNLLKTKPYLKPKAKPYVLKLVNQLSVKTLSSTNFLSMANLTDLENNSVYLINCNISEREIKNILSIYDTILNDLVDEKKASNKEFFRFRFKNA